MGRHLTQKEIGRLKALYENGASVPDISHRLRCSERTIFYHANANGWVKGENKAAIQAKAAEKESERMTNELASRAEDLRDSYLKKVQVLENMTSATLRALGSTPEEIRETSQSEANRIFSILKSLKISSEISNLHYEAARKALGLDQIKEEEAEEILPIKINIAHKPNIVEEEVNESADTGS